MTAPKKKKMAFVAVCVRGSRNLSGASEKVGYSADAYTLFHLGHTDRISEKELSWNYLVKYKCLMQELHFMLFYL